MRKILGYIILCVLVVNCAKKEFCAGAGRECDSFLFVNLFKFDKKENRNFPNKAISEKRWRVRLIVIRTNDTPSSPYANRMLFTKRDLWLNLVIRRYPCFCIGCIGKIMFFCWYLIEKINLFQWFEMGLRMLCLLCAPTVVLFGEYFKKLYHYFVWLFWEFRCNIK